MTLRQLEYLVAVAETGSFTHAAERALVSQPSFSRQVRALEASVGGELVDRSTSPVTLTPLGHSVLPHARDALAAASEATQAAHAVSRLEAGELRLATLTSIALGVVPGTLRAWHHLHPQVRVELIEQPSSDALVAAMARGAADVAIGPAPGDWEGVVAPLGAEELLVVLPRGDPLLDALEPIDLHDLADRPWVLYHRDSGLAPLVEAACAEAGFSPRAAVRARHTSSATELAVAGLGPTLAPGNVVAPDVRPFARSATPAVHRAIAAYTRSGPSPSAAEFVAVLRESVRL